MSEPEFFTANDLLKISRALGEPRTLLLAAYGEGCAQDHLVAAIQNNCIDLGQESSNTKLQTWAIAVVKGDPTSTFLLASIYSFMGITNPVATAQQKWEYRQGGFDPDFEDHRNPFKHMLAIIAAGGEITGTFLQYPHHPHTQAPLPPEMMCHLRLSGRSHSDVLDLHIS